MTHKDTYVRNSTTVSFWERRLPPRTARPMLTGDQVADVCIVGGGFTGLWTAYYLAKAAPALRIVVVEAAYCGYGASGRNGGWISNFIAGSRKRFADTHGRAGSIALQRAMDQGVQEIIRVVADENLDVDITLSGALTVARWRSQWDRLQQKVAHDEQWGERDQELLTRAQVDERLRMAGTLGGAFTPHCAKTDPYKLVRELAALVESIGVTIYEGSVVTGVGSHHATTHRGAVRADHVVLATEGFLARVPGFSREMLPINSSMIVTEPIAESVWDRIGWQGAELLGDGAHVYFYAQRTDDDRIAFGGRGNPYRYGSRLDTDGSIPKSTVKSLRAQLVDCFPDLAHVQIADAWSGVLGVPRDWCSSVTKSEDSGLIVVGGYVGHGVTTANLAGRTVRDLILERETPETGLPWVDHATRRWEPEPLRWLGVQGMYAAYRTADAWERRTGGRTSLIAKTAGIIGGR